MLDFNAKAATRFGLGYVNKLHHPIMITEHGYGVAQPFTLKPGEIKPVGFGHVADTIDIQRPDDQSVAHHRTRETSRTGASRGAEYVVVGASIIHIERTEVSGIHQ